MKDGIQNDKLLQGSQLETLLQNADNYKGLSNLAKMVWDNSTAQQIANGLSWLSSGAVQSLYGQGESFEIADKNGRTFTGKLDDEGNFVASDGAVFDAGTLWLDREGEAHTT